jgi:hypothetical protein
MDRQQFLDERRARTQNRKLQRHAVLIQELLADGSITRTLPTGY